MDSLNPALELLLNRYSSHRLMDPGPSNEELELIFQAALRVPDFQRLRPFRFLAARGDGLDRLGNAMAQAAIAAKQPEQSVARAAKMPHRAPLVVVVASVPKSSETVPVFEQQISAACTVLMMQLAARALGYGGVWRSGWMMHDRGFHRELGLLEGEQIVGFLYLGTPARREEPKNAPENPYDYLTWL